MGNISSIDARYVRIWNNLSQMESTRSRMQMLETLLSDTEYVNAAKRYGVYAGILQWIAATRRGEYAQWPSNRVDTGMWEPPSRISHADPRRKVVKETAIATIPPPKRALDALHEAYRVLSIDDTKPLSHESLRAAYKKAAARAHPDKGGSAAAFDAVTRAFLYLEEVINKIIPKDVDASHLSNTVLTTTTTVSSTKFTEPVTVEHALKMREKLNPFDTSRSGSLKSIESGSIPSISLNPKKLDMNVFNQLFEENRLPDPDRDGYGDWLKSEQDVGPVQNTGTLRSKFNADVFNKTFMESAKPGSSTTSYGAPDAIYHSIGTELGRGGGPTKPQFTAPIGAKTNYTDLKYAYGEGSTFSQEVANVRTDPRSFEKMKMEHEAPPTPLTPQEMAAVKAMERQKELMELERQRRVSTQDMDTESAFARLKSRISIN